MADSALVSSEQLVGLTRLTVEEIRECVKSGHIPKPAGGRYNLTESIKGAFLFLFEQRSRALTWDKAKLRTITGLSDQRHWQLANEGHFPAAIRGRYQVEATCAGIIRYFKELHQRRDKTLSEKRERKLDNENTLLEISIAERNKELISLDDMDARLRPLLVSVRQKILSSAMTDDEKDELLTDLGEMLEHALTRNIKESPREPGPEMATNLDQASTTNDNSLGG